MSLTLLDAPISYCYRIRLHVGSVYTLSPWLLTRVTQ